MMGVQLAVFKCVACSNGGLLRQPAYIMRRGQQDNKMEASKYDYYEDLKTKNLQSLFNIKQKVYNHLPNQSLNLRPQRYNHDFPLFNSNPETIQFTKSNLHRGLNPDRNNGPQYQVADYLPDPYCPEIGEYRLKSASFQSSRKTLKLQQKEESANHTLEKIKVSLLNQELREEEQRCQNEELILKNRMLEQENSKLRDEVTKKIQLEKEASTADNSEYVLRLNELQSMNYQLKADLARSVSKTQELNVILKSQGAMLAAYELRDREAKESFSQSEIDRLRKELTIEKEERIRLAAQMQLVQIRMENQRSEERQRNKAQTYNDKIRKILANMQKVVEENIQLKAQLGGKSRD